MEKSEITDAERRKIFWIAVVIMLLISLPYFLGYAFEGADWRFSGAVIGVEDVNSYIAKMRLGTEGDWLFRTPYTHMEQGGVLLYLPFVLLGKLTGGTGQHEQLVALYHLFRIVAGVFALVMTYRFIGIFIEDLKLRKWAWLTAVLGGGLGWLLALLGQAEFLGSYPLDFLSPESYGFLSWYAFPHLAAARGLMLWGMMRFITQNPQTGWFSKEGLKTGLIFLAMTLCQPLALLVTGVVMISVLIYRYVYQVWQTKDWKLTEEIMQRFIYGFWSGLLSGLYAIYLLIRFLQDDYLQIWITQNDISALPLVHYLLGYGLLLPLVYIGIRFLRKEKSFKTDFMRVWLALIPVFVILPLSIQRRLADGAYVALVILAFLGLEHLGGFWKEKGRYVLFGLLLPTSLLIWLGGLTAVIDPAEPVFIPIDQAELMLVLNEEAEKGDLVLSAYETANTLPAWAPVTVMNGHGPESADLEFWQSQINTFYAQDTIEEFRIAFLIDNNVQFVWWGLDEYASGDWKPESADYLVWVDSEEDYTLYKVDFEELMGDE